MKKKINTGFMLIAAIAIVVTAVCSMFLFYQILEEQIFDDLKANAHVVSVISPDQLSKDITYSLETDGLRITCVDENVMWNMTAWKMYLPWKIIKNVRKSQKQ